MGSHPVNLIIRFLLELSALVAMGVWGWKLSEGWSRWVLAIGIPIVAMALWGTFAVPNDPSRSGTAPVPIPGFLRLTVELGFFAFAAWALYDLGYPRLCWAMGIAVTVHYIISYDRILWLFSQ